MQDEDTAPALRFKKRKIVHNKRVPTENKVDIAAASESPGTALPDDAHAPANGDEDNDAVPNLKEILRNRKRFRDRFKVAKREPEKTSVEVATTNPRPDQYSSRFVAPTGQIVDHNDKQMTEYVDARLAEQNYRKYGWPIPEHLQATVARIAPDLKSTFETNPSTQDVATSLETATNKQHSERLAAGQGKLQEVDLGPDVAARVEKDWKRLEAGEPEEEPASKARRAKYGFQWRRPKRRNSDAERRDKMVEEVLKEAKLDYFDDTAIINTRFEALGNNDDAVAERFRAEYFEAMEEQQQRKPPPTASNVKGVKEAPKGPKLGGSKSARAKMRLQEEQAAKGKR